MGGCQERHFRFKEEDVKNKGGVEIKEGGVQNSCNPSDCPVLTHSDNSGHTATLRSAQICLLKQTVSGGLSSHLTYDSLVPLFLP